MVAGEQIYDARNFKGLDEPLFAPGLSKWTLRVPRHMTDTLSEVP